MIDSITCLAAMVCGAGGGTLLTFAVDGGPLALMRDRVLRPALSVLRMERVVECRPCACVWCGLIAAAVGIVAPGLVLLAAAGLGAGWVGWVTLPLGRRDQAELRGDVRRGQARSGASGCCQGKGAA